ncbi:FAD-dependent monooxygenase [Streptomyces sp. VRA16 Mangrove soil]|uniref:FAD-dependent monooxygenase n=1 Tax=Streptomyces sp. VRA16 Mangrove soil TaxID=2817434 RepID=UPI001A9CDF0B|nr:FAD-dependent monooxygenase [Streptomyces sp. VRA16 Mangrove soil]MBO1330356.1 FAD-dependent monooxygenase [Streptomyces sp. VRA16 Mangrove soil]
MSPGSVLIVGGGTGGPSTAIALRNAGHAVHVVEPQADPHASVDGVGIGQPVYGLRALDAIGCAEACMAVGYPTTAWRRTPDETGLQEAFTAYSERRYERCRLVVES